MGGKRPGQVRESIGGIIDMVAGDGCVVRVVPKCERATAGVRDGIGFNNWATALNGDADLNIGDVVRLHGDVRSGYVKCPREVGDGIALHGHWSAGDDCGGRVVCNDIPANLSC